jgi:hypothetical protein
VSREAGKLQADMVSAHWINKTKPAWVIIGSRWCIMVLVQVTTSIMFEFLRSASRNRRAVVPQGTQKKTVAEPVLASKWSRRHIDCHLPSHSYQYAAINTRATRCQCHLPSHILEPVSRFRNMDPTRYLLLGQPNPQKGKHKKAMARTRGKDVNGIAWSQR